MSKGWTVLPMWAHYADKFTGAVIEFDGRHEYFKWAFDVQYSHDRPVRDLELYWREPIPIAEMCDKSKAWEYEQEVRLPRCLSDCKLSVVQDGVPIFVHDIPQDCIKQVILGERADNSIAKDIYDLIERTDIPGSWAVIDSWKYDMRLIPFKLGRSKFAGRKESLCISKFPRLSELVGTSGSRHRWITNHVSKADGATLRCLPLLLGLPCSCQASMDSLHDPAGRESIVALSVKEVTVRRGPTRGTAAPRGCPKSVWISFDLSVTLHRPSTRRCRVHRIWIGPCSAAGSSERRCGGGIRPAAVIGTLGASRPAGRKGSLIWGGVGGAGRLVARGPDANATDAVFGEDGVDFLPFVRKQEPLDRGHVSFSFSLRRMLTKATVTAGGGAPRRRRVGRPTCAALGGRRVSRRRGRSTPPSPPRPTSSTCTTRPARIAASSASPDRSRWRAWRRTAHSASMRMTN